MRSREFQRAEGQKVRDPGEDIVATYRLLGIRMDKPRADDSAVNALLWQAGSIGIYPLAWPRPDGQPIDNATWSTPGRLMSSMSVHYTVSNGWWPTKGVHRPEGKDWLPKVRVRFDDLVDHLSRSLLHVPASDRLSEGLSPGDRDQAQRDHRPGARTRRVGHGPPAHDVPRLPRIHEQVTPA